MAKKLVNLRFILSLTLSHFLLCDEKNIADSNFIFNDVANIRLQFIASKKKVGMPSRIAMNVIGMYTLDTPKHTIDAYH